ncbi:MAG: pilus assembly protein PilP [Desulfobacterales bacterium]
MRKKITAPAETGQRAAQPAVLADKSGKPLAAQAAPLGKPDSASPLARPEPPASPQTAQQPPGHPSPVAPEPAPKPQLPTTPTRSPQIAAVSNAGLPAEDVAAVKTTAASDHSQVATLLNIQVPEPYNPKGKVDPFEPLLKDESAAAVARVRVKADPNRPKTPLEKLDLGQLKLVAIIAAPTGNRALVEEASGKGYIIKAGTFIGVNSGKVVDIKDGKVLVEEEFEDVYGKAITQKKEITLPKPPGEL